MEASTETPPAVPDQDELRREAADALGLQSDEERAPRRVDSADALKARALHRDFVLPSGAVVDIKIPNLQLMIKSGVIPNDLVDAALQHQNAEKVTREIIEQTYDYTRFIVPRVLVRPEVTEDDVDELDPLDIELLVNVAARRRDTDAIGRQLGGLDTQDSFRRFREESFLREALGGV